MIAIVATHKHTLRAIYQNSATFHQNLAALGRYQGDTAALLRTCQMMDAPMDTETPDTPATTLEASLETNLDGLKKVPWIRKIAQTAMEHGHFKPLGQRHFAAMITGDSTLLVTFETLQAAQVNPNGGRPLGWDFALDQGWSHLGLFSDGDSWFRDTAVYSYFDALIDDGFFEQFDTVLFYGAGPGGYAACAYSVASPGARVLAVQPQATLDPRIAEWDGRFAHMRRTDFSTRYGYAPDMVDAAEQAILVYDPAEELDAMHVALFTRSNVLKLRMRFMGTTLQGDMWRMNILMPSLLALADGTLDHNSFARLYRRRRDYGNYLRSLLGVLDQQQRPGLTVHLCRHAVATIGAPRFRRRLEALQQAAAEGQITLPPARSSSRS